MSGRVFLSGPMTGVPFFNKPEFDRVAAELRALGFHVENPAENHKPPCGGTWEGWMRLSLAQLLTCDRVVLLRGWENSRGAKLEFQLANKLSIDCVEWAYPEEGVPH